MTLGPTPRTARRLGVALVVAPLAVLSLSACSGLGDPSAAAVVDGEVISERDVQTIATELSADGGAVTPVQVLPLLVVAPVVSDVASQLTGAASRQDAQAALDANSAAQELQPGTYSDITLDFVATNLELNAIQQNDEARTAFTEALADLDADINPRYGSVDPETGLQGGINPDPGFAWLPAIEAPQG